MTFNASLQCLFEEGLEKFKDIIIQGYAWGERTVPVLDPLETVSDFNKNVHIFKNCSADIIMAKPEITGLQSLSIAQPPLFNHHTGTITFGLHIENLALQTQLLSIEAAYKLFVFDRTWKYRSPLLLHAKDVTIDCVLDVDLDLISKFPSVSARGTRITVADLKADCKKYRILDSVLPYCMPHIQKTLSQKMETSLSSMMTEHLQKFYEHNGPTIDKVSTVYQLKQHQGGWPQEKPPRIFQGFDGVGELPLPTFWKLPAVDTVTLEHRSVHSIMNTCATGDLILFSGTAPSSQRIRRMTQCPFSHVVMVVKEPEFTSNQALIWQATASSHHGVLRDRDYAPGIQLNPLDEMIREYRHDAPGATVVYRRLQHHEPDEQTREISRQALHGYIRNMDGKPYTHDMDGLYLMGLLEVDDPQEENYFCAGLVAQSLMHLGILRPIFKQHQYAPRDFSKLQRDLPFRKDTSSLGEYIVITPE